MVTKYYLKKGNCTSSNFDGSIATINRYKKDRKYFKTTADIVVALSTGETVTIPKGFEFDGSSRPKFLGFVFEKFGPFMLAALIHDWMYVKDYKREELGLKAAQKLADDEMLYWSKLTNNHSFGARLDNKLRYWGVRAFGKSVYKYLETDEI